MACRRYGERRTAGHKEGKHQALLQVAEAMRKRGIDDAAIMEMTGLSEDELQRLRH
jgi:predicted transposase/invertase (TIGR01784 family)